ncbi:hypothetical protein SVAN01_09301 [Stagonosporopsis vannaccii]|nr:hypothetical protein SVAN01_09301 [Stagonosporopsis vannaccii]
MTRADSRRRAPATMEVMGLLDLTSREESISNPTDDRNWPREPTTLIELGTDWIPATRKALLTWLQETASRVMRASDAHQIKTHEDSIKREWDKWKRHADLETGILPTATNTAYNQAMQPLLDNLAKVYEDMNANDRHVEHVLAQAAWEDFLYYQNEWNRRRLGKDSDYFETAAEARKARAKATSSAPADVSGSDIKTPDQMYATWRDCMITRYTRFRLGSRESVPDSVGPEIAHRFSQPPRGTTPLKQRHYRFRHRRLNLMFPGCAGRVSNERDCSGSSWTVDHRAFALEKEISDQGYLDNPKTKRLLPKDHVLHHGVLESSFDWPTSFDATEWGNFIAVTAVRRKYVYDIEQRQASDGHMKRCYKRDEQNRRIRRMEKVGYKKTKQGKEIAVFIHNLNEDGSVKGRDRDGNWVGQEGTALVDEYTNDPRYELPQPDTRYCSMNEFKIVVIPSKWPRATRYQRHEQANESANGEQCVDQLSDTEAPDCIKSNVNFCRSGNVKSHSGTSGVVEVSPGDESASSDDDSDDEEDPFTQSYLLCSGPACEHAKAVLVNLEKVYGKADPRWSVLNVVALIDASANDLELARIYQESREFKLRNNHRLTPLASVQATRQLLALEQQLGHAGWTVACMAAALVESPEQGALTMRYSTRVNELNAQAEKLLARLVSRFGNIGRTREGVLEDLCNGKTEDAIEDTYQGYAELVAEIANKKHARQAGATVGSEQPEQDVSHGN